MRLPNFFMVGAGKAGTSSLYFYLKEHPDIYMCSIKEPHFFADKKKLREHIDVNLIVDSWEEYINLFKGVQCEKIIGEASTSYLHYADPQVIKSAILNAKILIILRDPIERAYSHYLMDVGGLLINPYKLPFISAIEEFPMFTQLGFYYDRVKRYIEGFGKNDVKIILHDDLKNDTLKVVKDIFTFLGVGTFFIPNIKIKYNSFSVPRSKIAFKALSNRTLKQAVKKCLPTSITDKAKKLSQRVLQNSKQKPEMEEEAKSFLKNIYREDVLKLQDLIQRDLSQWLEQ